VQPDIVIVTYRSAAHLPACLAALPPRAPVFVVENNSGDEAADLAAAAGGRVIRNGFNAGFGAAANQGAAIGDGELILFLNPDAVILPADLELLVKALDADPRLAAVGPRLVYPDGSEQTPWWPFSSPAGTWREALGLHRVGRRPCAGEDEGFIVGACLLVRRAAFEALGGFDSRFWLYGEEADLCRRLWNAGWRVGLVPEAAANHIGGASGVSIAGVTFEHFHRGTEHFIAKHHGRSALVSHRLGLLTGSLLRLPALAARRDAKAGYRWAVIRRLIRCLATHPSAVVSPAGKQDRSR
jgi:GT2 family glycosyltransferase